jgi:hypothetical protein
MAALINDPRGPQPILVHPGVTWPPLGKQCEINNCGNPAYKTCDQKDGCTWKGCGKAICMDHCEIEVG